MQKANVCGIFVMIFLTTEVAVCAPFNYIPPNGVVPDQIVAAKIADVVLSAIYGKAQIDSEKPLKAKLRNNIWTVEGTFHQNNDVNHKQTGGVAEIDILKQDGRVLRISHGM